MLRPLSRLWLVRFLIPALGDLAILFGALAFSIVARGHYAVRDGLVASFSPLFLVFIGVYYEAGLYELRRVRDFVSLIGGLLVSASICLVGGTIYFYLFSPYFSQTPKTFLVLTVVFSH